MGNIKLETANRISKIQLVSKEHILESLEEINSEFEISEKEDSVSSDDYSDLDLSESENVPLMYAGIECELTDCGFPEINSSIDDRPSIIEMMDSVGKDLDSEAKSMLKNIIMINISAFAQKHDELVGIKNSEFEIEIVKETTHVFQV
ncbi:hypothetical protein AYI69_g10621 [Smittium culicis]|uniref:Uncharacterized protein n=1 Tax=Smittium culicis TaxID=133412 RepID=A0A1R1X4E3_9FUNG|nr:hypothetical protein AYI69_g10621 [Smittium culicis]